MRELQGDGATGGVHRAGQSGQAGDKLIGVHAELAGLVLAFRTHVRVAGYNQAHAAAGERSEHRLERSGRGAISGRQPLCGR